MAVPGRPDGAHDVRHVVEGVVLGDHSGAHPVHLEPGVGADPQLALQPVDLDGLVGHPEGACFVPRGSHPGLGLELCVELSGVLAHEGQRVTGH